MALKNAAGIIALVIAVFAILAGSWFHAFSGMELDALDWRFRMRPQIPATDKIAIIEISDDSIKDLGRFPFDRKYHASLVQGLKQAGAKAIVFDILFSEDHPDDDELELAINYAGNVYVPYVFGIDTPIKGPIARARGYAVTTMDRFTTVSKGAGHINVAEDRDGKFRKVPAVIEWEGEFFPYLSLLVGMHALGYERKDIQLQPGRSVKIGDKRTIPLDENSNLLINFTGPWGSAYEHYSYATVVRSFIAGITGEAPLMDLSVFKDKICLIGLTADGTSDMHPSPFSPLFPALGLHADLINSMIQDQFISRAPKAVNLLILILGAVIVFWAAFRNRPLRGFFVLSGIVILFVIACLAFFSLRGVWIDMVYPIIVMAGLYFFCTGYKYFMEYKNRLIMENELAIAKQIQESFLPKSLPQTPALDIACVMYSAKQVGGDLYDFLEFSDHEIGVMIGDVTGKGIPASLFMSLVVGAFKFFAAADVKPEETLLRLNKKLKKESTSRLFVTMGYAIFDLKTKSMAYASGGHLPLLFMKEGAAPAFLDVDEGMPLGMIDRPYSGGRVDFDKGTVIVFYTDGITEARNSKGEMYESHRLAAVAARHREKSAKELARYIEADVRRFEPVHRQHDDLTFLVIKIT